MQTHVSSRFYRWQRCERDGKPLVLLLTKGQRHEQPVLPLLMEQGAVKRPGQGQPRIRPDRVAADKGSSSLAIRRYLAMLSLAAILLWP